MLARHLLHLGTDHLFCLDGTCEKQMGNVFAINCLVVSSACDGWVRTQFNLYIQKLLYRFIVLSCNRDFRGRIRKTLFGATVIIIKQWVDLFQHQNPHEWTAFLYDPWHLGPALDMSNQALLSNIIFVVNNKTVRLASFISNIIICRIVHSLNKNNNKNTKKYFIKIAISQYHNDSNLLLEWERMEGNAGSIVELELKLHLANLILSKTVPLPKYQLCTSVTEAWGKAASPTKNSTREPTKIGL